MHLDLRYPIGLLLTTYGAILAVQGAMVEAKVLNLNVNLYWGAAMTVCGPCAPHEHDIAHRVEEGSV
jgi:hypothetical protein